MNSNGDLSVFGDPLTLHLEPLKGQNLILSNICKTMTMTLPSISAQIYV